MLPTTTATTATATTASKTQMASSSSSSSSSSFHNPTDTVTVADVMTGATAAGSPLPLPHPAPPPPLPSSRRPPPPCWTHEETLALIDSYREKWYSLSRGNLRANHWQEVADAVSVRCHSLPAATPKTSVQCRHKIEKLRKRYRAEKQRSLSHDPSARPTSSWVYFRKMDAMERGSATASAASRPSPSPPPAAASPDDDGEDNDNDDDDSGRGTTRSLHRLKENGRGIRGLRFRIPKAVRSKVVGSRAEERVARRPSPSPSPSPSPNPTYKRRSFWGSGGAKPEAEEMRRRVEKKKREREGEAVGEMVAALRMLGDGFMRIEQTKMEMARKMEKVRMEMELKRTEMILDCQREIVDSIVKGFIQKKRAKASPDP